MFLMHISISQAKGQRRHRLSNVYCIIYLNILFICFLQVQMFRTVCDTFYILLIYVYTDRHNLKHYVLMGYQISTVVI